MRNKFTLIASTSTNMDTKFTDNLLAGKTYYLLYPSKMNGKTFLKIQKFIFKSNHNLSTSVKIDNKWNTEEQGRWEIENEILKTKFGLFKLKENSSNYLKIYDTYAKEEIILYKSKEIAKQKAKEKNKS